MADYSAKYRAKHLRDKLNRWSYHYYALASPLVSDQEYDKAFRELHDLELDNPDLKTPDSPTQRIGHIPVGKLQKREHSSKMYSLDNVFSIDELDTWLEKHNYPTVVVQPKLDGAAVEIEYQRGYLFRGLTRGDGAVGEDVTHIVRTIRSLPLAVSQDVTIRGEVVLLKDRFVKQNEKRLKEGKPEFVNPRNAAAGTLRQLNPQIASEVGLSFYAYDVLGEFANEQAKLDFIAQNYIPVVKSYECKVRDEILTYVNIVQHEKANFPYGIDGVVIKILDTELQNKLGYTTRAPRWALAYKFQPEQAETVIKDIIVQVGRTGVLTPVAELDPVEVGQVTISRATLHNQDMIKEKNINIGDRVVIQRAGEVIPEIVRVSEKAFDGYFLLPPACPVCGDAVVRLEGEAATRCTNVRCKAKLIESLKHFCSRDALNIDGLGERLIEQLVEKNIVSSPYDLFTLLPLHFNGLERVGDKLISNVIGAIHRARVTTLDRFIHALGIPLVGKQVAKQLSEKFIKFESFQNAKNADLLSMSGIGPEMVSSIKTYFANEHNQKLIEDLRNVITIEMSNQRGPTRTNRLSGKTFVITGDHFTPREELKVLIEENGGRCVGSVSGKVDVLLAGRAAGPKKINKAQELKIPVWSEKDLLDLIK